MSVENKVPEIRFKGFSWEWDAALLKDVSTYSNGGSFENDVKDEGKYELVTLKSVDMNGNLVSSGRCIDVEAPTLPKDTLVMILSEQSPGLLGMTARIPVSDKYVLNQRVAEIRPLKNIESYFLSMAVNRNQRYFSERGAGTKVQNISKPNVENYEFLIPQKEEQTAIGNYFQKLDSLVNLHQQKHDKLSHLKKAMLEKMFPKQGETIPEIRFKGFSGKWEEKELGSIAQVTMGQSPSGQNYTNNPNDFILVQGNADLKNGFVVPRVWTSEVTKKAVKGALIFSVRAPVGEVGKTNYDVVLGRGVAAVYGNEFIYQQLQKLKSDNYWHKVSAGSTFDAISSTELASTLIWISSEPEQEKIGNYFQKLDTLINQHQQQITKLTNIKQACLSKMFV